MAIQLTTNWQNVAYAVYEPGTGFRATFYLDAKYSTQSTANNNTTIQTRLNCTVNVGQASGYGYDFGCSYANNVSGSNLWTIETETITSGEAIIQHNEDGTKTLNLSAYANIYGLGMYISMNGDVILPSIARYPLIIQAPDFSDEDNPTITYTTSLGFPNSTIETGIFSSDGNTAYASYRQITLVDGSYTFNLTSAERNTLRSATPNSNRLSVMFKIRTTTPDNVQYISSSTKTMTIVNANPTYTYTTTELNNKVIALLGDSANTIVQNVSNVRFVVSPTLLKNAGSIANVKMTHGGRQFIDTTSPYEIDIPVVQNNFGIVVKDSRGNGATGIITKTLITYQPVDITNLAMKRQNPTSSNVILNMEAVYYQRTFGSTANVPIVKWKVDDGSYTTIPSSSYTIDTTNNKLTISNYTLSNAIDYTLSGTITIEISDKLTVDTDARNIIKGIATYDVGEHDLQVNGDLFVADINRNNSINVLEEINNRVNGVYSTNEQEIGKWVNGETLYRKTFTNVLWNENGSHFSTDITNLDEVKNIYGTVEGKPINFVVWFNNVSYYIATWESNGDIYVQCSSAYDNTYGNVTIEYTKTS